MAASSTQAEVPCRVQRHHGKVRRREGLEAVFLGAWVLLLGRRGIFGTSALEDSIDANVDFSAVKGSYPDTLLIYNTVDLQTGNVRFFNNRDDDRDTLRKALLASSNMPVFTNPVEISDEEPGEPHQYVDGGVREFLPLEAIYKSDVPLDRIVAISTAPLSARRVEGGYDGIAGILIVMKKVRTKREIDVLLIAPEHHIDMDPLTFEPEKMQELMKCGMQVAKKAIQKLM